MEMRRRLDTMLVSWYVFSQMSPQILTRDHLSAIYILRHPSHDCPSLEQNIRSCRPQTRHYDRSTRSLNIHVLLWSLQNFLGSRFEVRIKFQWRTS